MRFFRVPYVIQSLFWNRKWTGEDSTSVYLTFDDGPDESVTPWLVNFLKKEKIPATFFCLGSQVKKHPELYDQIISHGHSVGNHTFNHEKGIKTADSSYLKSIKATDLVFMSNLFRPPYGRMSLRQGRLVLNMNKKIIMWSWISHDYDKRIDSNTIVRKARKIKGGDILLFHNNSKSLKNTIESLPEVVRIIREKHLTFKAISL
jgi:peptidoglycan/xylan/chitin deacetylase (PgdA/CDA1 family)